MLLGCGFAARHVPLAAAPVLNLQGGWHGTTLSRYLIRLLVNIVTHQLTITQDIRAVLHELRAANVRQSSFNEEQVAINARLEKLLQGLLPPSPNGH